jgi:hypothetical protein
VADYLARRRRLREPIAPRDFITLIAPHLFP